MIFGPDLTLTRTPKCASTWLADRIAAAGLGAGRPGEPHSHRGFASEPNAAGLRIASIRDPWAWHVSHYHHWLQPDGAPGDRLTCWGAEADADPVAQLRGSILRIVAPDGSARPNLGAWPGLADAPRWCADRECGLLTWGYVRQVYPRECWGWSVERLTEEHDAVTLADVVIDAAQASEGLQEVAARMGWTIPGAPPLNTAQAHSGAQAYDGDARGMLGAELCSIIGQRERLICEVFGYPGEVPAARWTERDSVAAAPLEGRPG